MKSYKNREAVLGFFSIYCVWYFPHKCTSHSVGKNCSSLFVWMFGIRLHSEISLALNICLILNCTSINPEVSLPDEDPKV